MAVSTSSNPKASSSLALAFVLLVVGPMFVVGPGLVEPAAANHVTGNPATYTLDVDFDEGTKLNVDHIVADQLQLGDGGFQFPFIWVAVSTKGTIVKIDTVTGAVLGEYWTSPDGMGKNPSRTTVDLNGNVWVSNRDEYEGNMGSVAHVGLVENGQCVDRNGNSVIDTSTGLGDVRAWTNAGGVDSDGGVDTAADECMLHYTRVRSTGTRHIAVTAENDVWVSGTGGSYWDMLDGDTGAIIRQEPSVGCGGYGGIIDANGVIWSASNLFRWDTALPLTAGNYTCLNYPAYGVCLDHQGNVWVTWLSGNTIGKFASDGTLLGEFDHGHENAQGCTVDRDDHVWVAHSFFGGSDSVGHLLNDGTWIGNVAVSSGPTGVSVDAAGKVWSTDYNTGQVTRIDPALGPIGNDLVTPVGLADFTSVYLGGNLYNYSDMTGSIVAGFSNFGLWTVVHDSGVTEAVWNTVSWTADEPSDSAITVTIASSDDGVAFSAPVAATNGGAAAVPSGRYIKAAVAFARSTDDLTPILYDLTVSFRPGGQALAKGVWAATAVPASLEYETRGLDVGTPGSGKNVVAVVDFAPTVYAEGLRETALFSATPTTAQSEASTTVAEVRLNGGQVVLRGLHQEAKAQWDDTAGAGVVGHASSIAELEIDGAPVPLPAPTDNVVIPLPGGGSLVLFERTQVIDAQGAAYKENLVHLYAPLAYGRTEVIVGTVAVTVGYKPAQVQEHLIAAEDDARAGGDAGDDVAGATAVLPGLYDGATPEGDAADAYMFTALHGEKIEFAVEAAPRGHLRGGFALLDATPPPTTTSPSQSTDLGRVYRVELFDPTGSLRETSNFPITAVPARVELNADLPGTWTTLVTPLTGTGRAHNYSMALTVTPLVLLPQRDALGPGDAPATCDPFDPLIPAVSNGLWPGVVRDDDFVDVYRFRAAIGEIITLGLKPGEDADGVDMALTLYDRYCNFLQRADLDGLVDLKGAPEPVLETPSAYTGDYFVAIERVNGVGNHYLALSVQNPMPTFPQNDAFTGTDASESRFTAGAAPPLLFQGRLEDNDAGDAYLMPLVAGRQAFLVVEMSATSTITATFTGPLGSVAPNFAVSGSHYVWQFTPTVAGTYGLEIAPGGGGGNYLVSWGQRP